MSPLRRRAAALFLLVALAAAACGAATGTTEAASGGQPLLSGRFDTIDGDTIDLASLEGQDVVFWFWAPW